MDDAGLVRAAVVSCGPRALELPGLVAKGGEKAAWATYSLKSEVVSLQLIPFERGDRVEEDRDPYTTIDPGVTDYMSGGENQRGKL